MIYELSSDAREREIDRQILLYETEKLDEYELFHVPP